MLYFVNGNTTSSAEEKTRKSLFMFALVIFHGANGPFPSGHNDRKEGRRLRSATLTSGIVVANLEPFYDKRDLIS